MKVEIKTCRTVKMPDMPVGSVGVIVGHHEYAGHIVLRAFDSAVSLNDPSVTWNMNSRNSLTVEMYPAGTVIELRTE